MTLRPTQSVGSQIRSYHLPVSTHATKPFIGLIVPESRPTSLRIAPASANPPILPQDSNLESHETALSLNALIHHPFILFFEGTGSWHSRRDQGFSSIPLLSTSTIIHRINIHISQSGQRWHRMYNILSSSLLITSPTGGIVLNPQARRELLPLVSMKMLRFPTPVTRCDAERTCPGAHFHHLMRHNIEDVK